MLIEERIIDFCEYTASLSVDIALGAGLGLLVNITVIALTKEFKLSPMAQIVIQFSMIICVLYVLKHISFLGYTIWSGPTAYGILFVSVFLGVQSNIFNLFNHVYKKERDWFNIVDSNQHA